MSDTVLLCDDRGVILPCPQCETGNRIAYKMIGIEGKCGACGEILPALNRPVEISSETSFNQLIAECRLPILIDFWAPWCGPCQMMASEFARAAQMAAGEAVLVKVNTENLPQIGARYRVTGIPAFALINNGQVVNETSGARQAVPLIDWMRNSL